VSTSRRRAGWWCQLKHRAVAKRAAAKGRPVERAVGALDQTGEGTSAVHSIHHETVQDGEAAAVRGYLENRARRAGTAVAARPVEGTVGALDQTRLRIDGSRKTREAMHNAVAAAVGGDLENRAEIVGAAGGGRPVQSAVGALDQAAGGLVAVPFTDQEAVQEGEAAAVGGHLEDRPGISDPADNSRPVEGTVWVLKQTGEGLGAVCRTAREAVQNGVAAAVGSYLEHRATSATNGARAYAADLGCPIERAVGGLDQAGDGPLAILRPAGETVQDGEAAPVGGHLENRAGTAGATELGCPIERAVGTLDQAGEGSLAVDRPAGETVQEGEAAAVGGHLENRAAMGKAAESGRPVKRAVGTLEQGGEGLGAVRLTTRRRTEAVQDGITCLGMRATAGGEYPRGDGSQAEERERSQRVQSGEHELSFRRSLVSGHSRDPWIQWAPTLPFQC